MKKQISIIVIFLFSTLLTDAQVVSGGSQVQGTTVKPGELRGSSFNGDVNLFTGTYSGNYTLGSVSTPGGLKFDVNMVYSSSLTSGDNVPVARGIPFGEGWNVEVPTITISAADYKSYNDKKLQADAFLHSPSTEDIGKIFRGDGNLYWFNPRVNIPGVVSGEFIYKGLDPNSGNPIFILHKFENQYVELHFDGHTFTAILPNGDRYEFTGNVSYRKGYNRRNHEYGEVFSEPIKTAMIVNGTLIPAGANEQISVGNNIKPKSEKLTWHCSRITNRNLPHQVINFKYKGFGEFNFFKEFSNINQPTINEAVRLPNTPGAVGFSTATGVPELPVSTDFILKEVSSTTGKVVLEYDDADYYGPDMLNPHLAGTGVYSVDEMYNKQVVYSSNTRSFEYWKRYYHVKAPFIKSVFPAAGVTWNIQPTNTNPFIAKPTGGLFGTLSNELTMLRKEISSSPLVTFDHGFLESPRLKFGSNMNNDEISLIGGDIYEVKTSITNLNPSFSRYANIDINIVTGLPHDNGDNGVSVIGGNGLEILDFGRRSDKYVNQTIFSTFGNAVKWNPAHTGNTTVHTSNFFTMPNIPVEYEGITVQIGPGNSDNFFAMQPLVATGQFLSAENAHRSYWGENFKNIATNGTVPYLVDPLRAPFKQHYEPVPNNFGIGLPWMMMKPLAHRSLGFQFAGLLPDEGSAMFDFWWNDSDGYPQNGLPGITGYPNTPTLLGNSVQLSNVEIIRYSKNPYLLQSVKTYKYNGAYHEPPHPNPNSIPGPVLVNQFDMEYDHDVTPILNNTLYEGNGTIASNSSSSSTVYQLKNIKNKPVNGTQDISNTISTNTNDYPTTHFEYETIYAGTPLNASNTPQELSQRTNSALFVLNKITSHLGKETNIDYYDFADPASVAYFFYKFTGPYIANVTVPSQPTISERNFAVQVNIPVKTITIADDPLINPIKKWEYSYEDWTSQEGLNLSSTSMSQSNALGSGSRNLSVGFKKTTVTEPEINGLRPYSKYYHHGEVSAGFTSVSQENLLFGKLKKVENFDDANFKISQKEILYKANLAFKNGINRPFASKGGKLPNFQKGDDIDLWFNLNGSPVHITTTYPGTTNVKYTLTYSNGPPQELINLRVLDHILRYYDYQDFDHEFYTNPNTNTHLVYENELVPTGMGNNTILAAASSALETASKFSILNYAKDSYFIKKIREIDTEYESDVCNIPKVNSLTQPTHTGNVTVPLSQPILPYVTATSNPGDEQLISEINENRYGERIEDLLINASPLSDNVLHALLDKSPSYGYSTYSKIIAEQSLLSDPTLLKILALPASFREYILSEAIIHQQGELSAAMLRSLILENFDNNAPLNTALIEYNFLPEDILLSILNKEIRYSTEFIESVLLSQLLLSENVHNQLLNSTYLSDNTIKNVFINGGNYPLENTLIAMINRVPRIEEGVIQDVLLASPYQHAATIIYALNSNAYLGVPQALLMHGFQHPSWFAYCSATPTSVILSIENITDFEYWDANEEGQTTSEGFRKLMDISDQTIDLMFEPSWQLYRTKSYSPQLPGAFTEKEYFYYYDLINKYNRFSKYLPNNGPYTLIEDEPLAIASLLKPYNIYYTGYDEIEFNDGQKGLKGFKPSGLRFSHELNLLNIAYQERTTSKNVYDNHPITRSTFYHYSSDWNDIIEDFTTTDIPYTGPACPPALTPDPVPGDDCTWTKFILFDTANVPPGWIVYWAYDGLMMCPPHVDPVAQGYGAVYYTKPGLYQASANRAPYTNDLKKTLHLKEVLTQIDTLVNEEYYNAINSGNNLKPIPFPSSTGLMEFRFDERIPFSDVYNYTPLYPFDVLKVKEVKERNQFTQVQLEENEQGLLTRYYYNISKRNRYINTNCGINGYGDYIAYNFPNIGVPTAITVGYGLTDSLRTEYDYYLDYSVENIIDPNGITLSYKYDEYGRLKESYRNNELLSINKYSTWDNLSTGFTNRAKQNYVETFQLKDKGNPAALHSRKYIDPLGRDFHTMSREVSDVYALSNSANKTVHTGAINYDNWNRATETYKPFIDVNTGLFDYLATSTNPNTYSSASYEGTQKSRVLREAKPGLSLGAAKNVKYRYSMANFICGGCDLDLNVNESQFIMGNTPDDFVFKVLEVEDEDGKVSKEYFNAIGQKVATKQFIGTDEAITLFGYDSYGNLTKVINPKKQESTYKYNMLGWLFQKETVDGGITKYMFNESGQVVLEQDEKDRDKRSCDQVTISDQNGNNSTTSFVDRPTYRSYTYDIFGRLTRQAKRVIHPEDFYHTNTIDIPMLYVDKLHNATKSTSINQNLTPMSSFELFHDGNYYSPTQAIINDNSFPYRNAFVYNFTNNSTYSWKAKTHIFQVDNTSQFANYKFIPENNFLPINQIFTYTNFSAEKELFYNGDGSSPINQHITTNSILAAGIQNVKGNLTSSIIYGNSNCEEQAKAITYDFYNYNNEGNLSWQIQQFNAIGIDATHKGIVTRIDYPKYDLNNNLLVENIDVNNDLELDLQYNYTYDLRNRLQEVKVGLTDDDTRELVASYAYNDATGLVTKTNYHKDCGAGGNNLTDQIDYIYDDRDRLKNINSNFFDYSLYYDNNLPSTALGPLVTADNYNGNINGTHAQYKFLSPIPMQGYIAGSNFEQPTSYAYTYDGINRLTFANAYWNENLLPASTSSGVIHYGDVSYQFDKIGNLKTLNRTIDVNHTVDQWEYKYQNGTNKLMQAEGMSGTLDRNYTYDGSGNLLTDDFRKVTKTIYGRANLPFDVELLGQESEYLYDAADARIFKGLYSTDVNNIGAVLSAEYYLKDAAGNTIGILDLNTTEWTWYVFGRERFAKIKPEVTQQPEFYNGDHNPQLTPVPEDPGFNMAVANFTNEVNAILNSETEEQVELLKIERSNGQDFWISETNLTTFTDTVQDTSYTIAQEIMLTNQRHLLKIGEELISLGALTGIETALSEDSILIDTAGVMISGNKFINLTNQFTSGSMLVNLHSGLGGNGSGGSVGGTLPPPAILPGIEYNYTYHPNTLLTDIDYYIHDHLGNTRVVYQPEFTQRIDIINAIGDLDAASLICPNGFLCSAWSPLANTLSNFTSGTMLVNSQLKGAEYAIETNVTTVAGQYYNVEFTINDDGSQLDNKFAEASGNGVVLVNTGYSSNNTINFAFTANSATTTFKVGALDVDPTAAPTPLKHFYLIGSVVTPTNLEYELKYAADYYPYGKILREWVPATGAEKYLTTHHERDTETGLDYRGARYYDSDIARFLSLDPKQADFAEWSPYNYVLGNPTAYIDPDGKAPRGAGGPPQSRRARVRRITPIPNGGKVRTTTFTPRRTQDPKTFNYLEPTTSVLDPISNIGNTSAPLRKSLVESFADVIETIKTRQEWTKNSSGELIKSKEVVSLITFKSPALQAKYNKLQGDYTAKFQAHVKGSYTDAEYKALPSIVKGLRNANAELQLGSSPGKKLVNAFKTLATDENETFDVKTVDKYNAVIYDSNK